MIVFTAIAGMASVAYMDVVIGSLATITPPMALPFVLHAAGGLSGVTHALPATHFQVLGDFSLAQALELFLPTMLLMLGNQSMYQKFFSADSEKAARNAVVGWIIGTVILETVIVALAVFGSVLFPSGSYINARERLSPIRRCMDCRPGWGRCDGGGVRQDHLYRQQLPVFSFDEPG